MLFSSDPLKIIQYVRLEEATSKCELVVPILRSIFASLPSLQKVQRGRENHSSLQIFDGPKGSRISVKYQCFKPWPKLNFDSGGP